MRPFFDFDLTTENSTTRVASSRLPARFVSTRSGLFFEWGLTHRAKVSETAGLVLSDQAAWELKRALLQSTWVAPPSLRKPTDFRSVCIDLELNELQLGDLKRAWWAALRRRHGRRCLSLCLRILPKQATLVDLNQVAAHQVILAARVAENPALAPLLANDRGMWNGLENWRLVKNRFLAVGLSAASWRWLARQPVAYIAKVDWSALSHLSWVNFHAALGRRLPIDWVDPQTAALKGFSGLGSWLRRHADRLQGAEALNVLRGVRLALERRQQSVGRAHKQELETEEFPLITDWLLASAASVKGRAARISRQWTYDTLMARQAHWHLVELDLDGGRPDVFWPEVLGMGSLNAKTDYFELTSLNALLNEAKKMHHCVPSYIDRCMAGDVCIFHLQIKGSHPQRATLEFQRTGARGWSISQLKGPCNSPVSAQLWAAAHELLVRVH